MYICMCVCLLLRMKPYCVQNVAAFLLNDQFRGFISLKLALGYQRPWMWKKFKLRSFISYRWSYASEKLSEIKKKLLLICVGLPGSDTVWACR
jgi:hypothetical protein